MLGDPLHRPGLRISSRQHHPERNFRGYSIECRQKRRRRCVYQCLHAGRDEPPHDVVQLRHQLADAAAKLAQRGGHGVHHEHVGLANELLAAAPVRPPFAAVGRHVISTFEALQILGEAAELPEGGRVVVDADVRESVQRHELRIRAADVVRLLVVAALPVVARHQSHLANQRVHRMRRGGALPSGDELKTHLLIVSLCGFARRVLVADTAVRVLIVTEDAQCEQKCKAETGAPCPHSRAGFGAQNPKPKTQKPKTQKAKAKSQKEARGSERCLRRSVSVRHRRIQRIPPENQSIAQRKRCISPSCRRGSRQQRQNVLRSSSLVSTSQNSARDSDTSCSMGGLGKL
eukprot:scaffold2986_cov249-Pinguiococcus_pyrenoidosus.AAC.3